MTGFRRCSNDPNRALLKFASGTVFIESKIGLDMMARRRLVLTSGYGKGAHAQRRGSLHEMTKDCCHPFMTKIPEASSVVTCDQNVTRISDTG
jgi:hypothetical protein